MTVNTLTHDGALVKKYENVVKFEMMTALENIGGVEHEVPVTVIVSVNNGKRTNEVLKHYDFGKVEVEK